MIVEFEDNSVAVKNAIENACIAWLHEAAGELQSQTQRNTRVDTSQTKGSFQYKIDTAAQKATIGSNLENAIWEEFGTGQYALHGDGRKSPWSYQDKDGKWHTTKGKRGTRALFNAFNSKKAAIKRALERKLGGIK